MKASERSVRARIIPVVAVDSAVLKNFRIVVESGPIHSTSIVRSSVEEMRSRFKIGTANLKIPENAGFLQRRGSQSSVETSLRQVDRSFGIVESQE